MIQRIAIPTNEGILWQHFGKAPQVTIFDVKDGKIVDSKVLQAPEHEHGAMPRFLAEQGCTDVLCGGLGQGAVNMLNQLGIRIHTLALQSFPWSRCWPCSSTAPSFMATPAATIIARGIIMSEWR